MEYEKKNDYLCTLKFKTDMIIMKHGLIFLCTGALILMTGCLGDGVSEETRYGEEVVIRHAKDGTTELHATLGTYNASDLSDYNDGDCLIANYTVDYTTNPYTAKKITVQQSVKQKEAVLMYSDSVMSPSDVLNTIGEFNYPISYVSPSHVPNFGGKFFFYIQHSADKLVDIEYQLAFYRADSVASNVYNVYLTARKLQEEGVGEPKVIANRQVFDVKYLILEYGEPILSAENYEMKDLKINLYYLTRQENEELAFVRQNTTTYDLALFADK